MKAYAKETATKEKLQHTHTHTYTNSACICEKYDKNEVQSRRRNGEGKG